MRATPISRTVVTASLCLLYCGRVFADGGNGLLARLDSAGWDTLVKACAGGNAASCAERRAQVADGISLGRGAVGSIGAAAAGAGSHTPASVSRWVDKVTSKISALRSSGALGILGMFGGGPLLGKVEAVLGTLKSNGGDIKQALQGGGLLGLVQDVLGEAKQVVTREHLGDGALIDRLANALPGLAQQVMGNQLSAGDAIERVKSQFGNDPLIRNLESAFGGLSGHESLGEIAQAASRIRRP